MKLYAYVIINNSYQKVSIFQALNNKRQFPKDWENMTYYLSNNPNNPIELIACGGSIKSPHFRIKSTKEESIYTKNPNYKTTTHNLCQEVLSEFKDISIHTNDNNIFSFYNCTCEKEKHIIIDEKLYIADLYFTFERSEPDYLAKLWDNHFILEIYVTHKVPKATAFDFYIGKHTVFELNASGAVREKVDSYQLSTDEALVKCTNYLKNMFSNKIYANLISNPAFQKMYKDKIEELNNAIEQINNENIIIQTNYNASIVKYNSLVAKYNSLIDEKAVHIAEKEKLRLQSDKLNSSIWGKIYNFLNK